jgi:signal transduction histidine kinase
MQRNRKQTLSIVLIVLILFGWGLSLMLAFPEHVSPLMLFAILLPVGPTAIVIWIQSRSVPENVLKKIHEIALRVEHDLEKERIAVDTSDIPVEIMPCVNAINRLLRYHHDRHLQERDFTAHASHELRTPLAGIRLQTELALATSDPAKREKALGNVIKSIDRSTRLVEQLLAISRLTSETVDLAKEHVDLVALLGRVANDHMTAAHQKHIDLSFSANADTIFVEASEDSLNILADNLVRNALIYTPSHGEVRIRVTKNAERTQAIIQVKDSGPGIPAHLRERVMKRFEKADKGSQTGTGLGLAIVKRIVDLHDGSVSLQDGADGKGLCVEVALPKKPA